MAKGFEWEFTPDQNDIDACIRPGLLTRKGGRKMEKATFHDHLTRLRELFPERETITVAEAARLVGCKPQTLRESRDFPMKPVGRAKRYHVVPIINLARWMAC